MQTKPSKPAHPKKSATAASTTRKHGLPEEVALILADLRKAFEIRDERGRKVGSSVLGVYLFYDYDGEPIYVGQTMESLRVRIQRHLTNQRTDAVAMNVLDPFEVAEIEMWPLDDLAREMAVGTKRGERKYFLDRAEYTLFLKAIAESSLGAILNEGEIKPKPVLILPQSYRAKIVPESLFEKKKHPDVRIARRATTIASLARVISERKVSSGLRRTLVTQARRLEKLAVERAKEKSVKLFEVPGEKPSPGRGTT